jgi:diguanylate cyclase (GGDEF)-like protein
MKVSLWRRVYGSGWLFVVVAVALAGVAWRSFDASNDRAAASDGQRALDSARLVEARSTFERSGLDLLVDRMVVGVGMGESDVDAMAGAMESLGRSYAEMEDLAEGDGPVADLAGSVVDGIDADMVEDPFAGDLSELYWALDEVRWATEDLPVTTRSDALFELAFFAALPDHVLVEGLAAYADVEGRPVDPQVADLFRVVLSVVHTEGGWFGADARAPLQDSSWFEIENARASFPEVTAEVEQRFASSDLVVADAWMRELGDSSIPAPMPLEDVLVAAADLESATAELIDPVQEALIAEAVPRAESVAGVRSDLEMAGYAAAAVAVLWLTMGLLRMVGRRRSVRRLSNLALRDALTGISNRHALDSLVEQALADGRYHHHVVAVVDLDRFKMVNDLFGHGAGDEVLRETGSRLRSAADAAAAATPDGIAHVVRIGGDEFLVALHAPTEVRTDVLTAELDAARQRPFDLMVEGRTESFVPEFSVGLADVRGRGDLEELMAAADLSAYSDKTERATRRRERGERTPQTSPAGSDR